MSNKHNHQDKQQEGKINIEDPEVEINDVADEENADAEAAKDLANEELSEIDALKQERCV